uniref:Uncharacterized protein n=1 Tax=Lutzomyia longipalpis TaxID=7200 RepID=A0A1B0CV56_LUTLO
MNAACNFLLYCAFSAKYRATVAHLLSRRPKRQGTISSRFSRYATRGTVDQSFRRKSSHGGGNGPPAARSRGPSISLVPRPSITPSDVDLFNMPRAGQQELQQSQHSFKTTPRPPARCKLQPTSKLNKESIFNSACCAKTLTRL